MSQSQPVTTSGSLEQSRFPMLIGILFALLAGALGPLTVATPAEGGLTECEYNPSTRRVSIETEESTEILRQGRDIYYKFLFQSEFRSCDGATIDNTDLIAFTDTSANGEISLIIDLSWGRFAPGATAENQGQSEIEFRLKQDFTNQSAYPPQMLSLDGTEHSDVFVGGVRGMKLNRDKDLDIEFRTGEGSLNIDTEAGNDQVFLDGREGTGQFDPMSSYAHVIFGDRGEDLLVGSTLKDSIGAGAGRDRIKGGPGNDNIYSENGDDRMWGQGGNDYLSGLDGDDYVIAGAGDDEIKGHHGNDHLEGSSGNDRIRGNQESDHLDGDAGNDECDGGPGHDTKEDCES